MSWHTTVIMLPFVSQQFCVCWALNQVSAHPPSCLKKKMKADLCSLFSSYTRVCYQALDQCMDIGLPSSHSSYYSPAYITWTVYLSFSIGPAECNKYHQAFVFSWLEKCVVLHKLILSYENNETLPKRLCFPSFLESRCTGHICFFI